MNWEASRRPSSSTGLPQNAWASVPSSSSLSRNVRAIDARNFACLGVMVPDGSDRCAVAVVLEGMDTPPPPLTGTPRPGEVDRGVDHPPLAGAELEVKAELGPEAEGGQRPAERLGLGLPNVVAYRAEPEARR